MTIQELIHNLERLRDRHGKETHVRVLTEGEEPFATDIIDIYEQHNEVTIIVNSNT